MADNKKKPSVYFISAECYPVAKVGGLADVTGALPKYLDTDVKVILPKYKMPWFSDKEYRTIFVGSYHLPHAAVSFEVQEVLGHDLGFPFYVIDVPGLLDRDGVYAGSDGHYFTDEAERYTAFQRAFLDWLNQMETLPDIIHCQDHHTGLVAFMMQFCPLYNRLKNIPTIFTIHNERYQGSFGWEKQYLLPAFDNWKSGMMDWNHQINPLAAGIKCSNAVTTVSPSYMEELKYKSFGLEWLFNNESDKLFGILNGIDTKLWDPKTDPYLDIPLKRSVPKFKQDNKKALLKDTPLDPSLPLVSFIGRFAVEKGADLLTGIIDILISQGEEVNFIILGTGDKTIENNIARLAELHPEHVHAIISYDEKMAHQMYAGSDFILMPSRVEPCGLNQMYALRYGTLPLVHNIGGLKDSIVDYRQGGYGFKFNSLFIMDIIDVIKRGKHLYYKEEEWKEVQLKAMDQNFSWDKSAQEYLALYKSLL